MKGPFDTLKLTMIGYNQVRHEQGREDTPALGFYDEHVDFRDIVIKLELKMSLRTDVLKKTYNLMPHEEGGSFSEVYTSAEEKKGRSLAGSIYFLLDSGEVSQFHEIDCDEIWFFHEGCGMKICILAPNGDVSHIYLGNDVEKGQRAMAIIPKGAIFSAVNLDDGGYTFVSCVTVPKFSYDGFRLVPADEIRQRMSMRTDEMVISI